MNCALHTLRGLRFAATAFFLSMIVVPAQALDIYTEDFTNDSANWANFNSSAVLDHFATGGPDGGAYAAGPRSFQNLTPGNITVILRARHDNPWNSSGDAFRRNWNAEGIRLVSAFVKHNFPEPLTYFVRAANPSGFPGATYFATAPTPPETWSRVWFDVSPNSPQLPSPDALEGSTWTDIFNDIGHLQFGVIVPGGHQADPTSFTFSIDKVTISTPEPAAAVLVVVAVLGTFFVAGRSARAHRAKW